MWGLCLKTDLKILITCTHERLFLCGKVNNDLRNVNSKDGTTPNHIQQWLHVQHTKLLKESKKSVIANFMCPCRGSWNKSELFQLYHVQVATVCHWQAKLAWVCLALFYSVNGSCQHEVGIQFLPLCVGPRTGAGISILREAIGMSELRMYL